MKATRLSISILILLAFNAGSLFSQQYGNEWINYAQDYYKVKTGKNGIHRISQQALIDAGMDLSSLDPRNLKLYHRGEEISIYVSGEEDGSFDSNDFIEFYGRRNDGTQDTELYLRPSYQAHQYYNLFSDTNGLLFVTNNKCRPSNGLLG